jgi:hypothetical protein
MANNLGSLVVSLGLDAGEFTRGLSKSEYQAQQWAKKFETGVEAARVAALGSLAAIGSAALVLNQQLQSIAGFQDLADKIGDSAQEVASLKLAADLSGVSLENVAGASVKLTSALSKLDDESEGAGKALGAIGIKLDDFKRLSPVAQIDAVAQAMAGFEDGASKTAVAVALFGKSGADLIPLLNDMAEEGGRQISLTGEQIKAADDYSKSLARLTSELQTMANVTAADAAPAMTEMVQIIRDVITYTASGAGGFSLLSLALDTAKTAMQALVVIGSDVAFAFKVVGLEIGGVAAKAAALASLDMSGFNAISEAVKDDTERARKELDKFQQLVLAPPAQASYSNEGRNYGGRNEKKALSFSAATPKAPTKPAGASDFDRYLLDLDKGIQATKQLTAEEKALEAIQSGRLGAISKKQQELLIGKAKELDTAKEFAAIEKKFQSAALDTAKARTKVLNDQQDAGKRLYESVLTPLEKLAVKEAEIQKLREAGVISQETYFRAREAANDQYDAALDKLNDKTKQTKSIAEELGLTFSSAFEDAILGGKGFSDVLKAIEKDIARIIIRKQITEPLANAVGSFDFGKLFSGGNGSGGSLFSFAGGGYTGDGSRSGGLDGQGGYLAMLHPQESVIDHAKGQGMGGMSISQNITIDARGADAGVTERIMQAMKQTKAETLAAVQAQANRGGSFARAVGRA